MKAHEFVHRRMEAMADYAKKHYDKTAAERDALQPGEDILLRNESRRSKLDAFWIGGWVVVESDGRLVTIERPGMRGSRKVVNINRVKSVKSRLQDLEEDDLLEPFQGIFHGVEENEDRPEPVVGTPERPSCRRYPLRNRRPPDRLNYTEF